MRQKMYIPNGLLRATGNAGKARSMEDGARTLRKQRAAYVGMQEWASEDAKRGGTADLSNLSRQSNDCRFVFLTDRFGVFYVLFLQKLALSAKEVSPLIQCCFPDLVLLNQNAKQQMPDGA